MTPRFTLDDAERAWRDWGCNCGPGALAATMGMTLDDWSRVIVPHLTAQYRRASGAWHITHAHEVAA